VVFGLGVVAFAWPLRRYLGRWGALSFLLLVTFSPSWTYFTRFVRHDIYLALCNLARSTSPSATPRARTASYLYLSAVVLGFAFTNKEDMYLMTPLFLAALAVMMLWGVVRGEQKLGRGDRETGSFLAAAAAILTSR
jgi:predicted membrane-bound mannosyltransferase